MMADQKVSLAEGKNLAKQMRNHFRQFEYAAEVLELAVAAEGNLAAVTKRIDAAKADQTKAIEGREKALAADKAAAAELGATIKATDEATGLLNKLTASIDRQQTNLVRLGAEFDAAKAKGFADVATEVQAVRTKETAALDKDLAALERKKAALMAEVANLEAERDRVRAKVEKALAEFQ